MCYLHWKTKRSDLTSATPEATRHLTGSEDEELAALASSFKQRRRTATIAVVANVILAVLALGLPAYRGRVLSREAQAQFAAYTGCLFGGRPVAGGGLGLPPGIDVRFAALVLRADDTWPGKCDGPLRAIAPPDATFLFPSIKRTGADVRAVVAMLEQESQAVADLRTKGRAEGIGQIPERPLLVLEKLRATLVLLSEAAGTDDALRKDAIAFDKPMGVVAPARLPIMGRPGGSLALWGMPNGVEAVATDTLGVSWLLLDDGRVDRRRARRSGLVRGVVTRDRTPRVVWATPERRCDEREDRCAHRATGIATFDRGSDALPKPLWLAGHPQSRIDRSVWVGAQEAVLMARAETGSTAEVRRFVLPEVRLEDAPPIAGEVALSAPGEGVLADALLLSGRPPRALFMERGVTGALTTTLVQPGDTPVQTLPPVQGENAWSIMAAGCQEGPGFAFAYGTETEVRLAYVPGEAADTWADPAGAQAAQPSGAPGGAAVGGTAGGGSLAASTGSADTGQDKQGRDKQGQDKQGQDKQGQDKQENQGQGKLDVGVARVTDVLETALPPVLDREVPGLDRVRLLCDGKRLRLVYLNADRELWQRGCTRAGSCGKPRRVARTVSFFDAVAHDGALVYAVSGNEQARQIRALSSARPDPVVPAPCWDPRRGLCGVPRLISDGERVLLAARDGADLLLMESRDRGRSWEPMSGVQVDRPVNTDPLAPMRQHMIRKGLETAY